MRRRRCAHKPEVQDDAGRADGDGDDILEVVLDVLRGEFGCGACVCGRAKAGSVRVRAAPLEHDAVARDEDGAVDVVAPGRPGVGGRPGARARACGGGVAGERECGVAEFGVHAAAETGFGLCEGKARGGDH